VKTFKYIAIALGLILLFIGCGKTIETIEITKDIARKETMVIKSVDLQDNFEEAKIKKEDLVEECFDGKDCIQSINKPKFETVSEADKWLNSEDLIFAINYKGVARGYPQKILNYHEIINDTIEGDSIAVTFSPLSGSVIAFERKVNNVITEFGVSGKLQNNSLVMYDRYEGNLWGQITGEALVGPAAKRNEKLNQISIFTTTWEIWKANNPKSKVLSKENGFSENYDKYPYGTYEENDELYFNMKNINKSLEIKTVVYGIEIDGKFKAYPKARLDIDKKIEDSINKQTILIEELKSGEIKVTNLSLKKEITPIRLFWFAWAAFHPDSEIYL
jgi:hypothetical protein